MAKSFKKWLFLGGMSVLMLAVYQNCAGGITDAFSESPILSSMSSGACSSAPSGANLILAQPLDVIAYVGDQNIVSLGVEPVDASATYDWRRGGVSIGFSAKTLNFANLSAVQKGIFCYSVVVTTPQGQEQSRGVTFQVLDAPAPFSPVFVLRPVSQSVTAGRSVVLSASANGYPSPTYQWFQGATALAPAGPGRFLRIDSFAASNAGTYSVTVSNSQGSTSSQFSLSLAQ